MVYQGGETTDGRRIYVGNINYDFREEELRTQFNEFGQITSLAYKQGYAFIDYADKRDAEDAIASMNGKQLGGRTITVELAGRSPKDGGRGPMGGGRRDDDMRGDVRGSFGGAGGGNSRSMASSDVATRNLFVGNIPPECTEEDVQRHFAKYGQITGVKFLPKKSDTIAAFVDFTQVDDARAAHDNHNEILGMKLRTDYNNRPAARGGPSGGPPPPPPPNSYDYDDRGPPPPSYDSRRYDERYDRPPPRYDERYDERAGYDRGGYGAPPAPRYDDRERDYYYERRAPPAPRYDDRGQPPPPRYDDRYRE